MQIITFDREYPQNCVQVLVNVKYVLLYETTLFWPEIKASFYRFILDPCSDPDSNPDSKRLFQLRIGSPDLARSFRSSSGSGSATLSVRSLALLMDFDALIGSKYSQARGPTG
jgi:hypothetical protein